MSLIEVYLNFETCL